jgi:UDP-N-acetylmuramoylalanine--D-glutamate ligase
MLDLAGKRVAVIGLGTSGLAAARLALSRAATLVLNDSRPRSMFPTDLVGSCHASSVFGDHDVDLTACDLVVVSPGVPPLAAIAAADRAGVSVLGEVDFALQCLPSAPKHLIAIGGTNGKSTVTSLLGAHCDALSALAVPGFGNVFTGGNLGEPLAAHADEAFDTVVLEVSSFQMERVSTFRPRVSLLLNITDDHLDRYPDFAAYARAKGNAFARQTAADLAVVPYGDPLCAAQAARGKGRVVTFGLGQGDVSVSDTEIVHQKSGVAIRRDSLKLQGRHNALNVAAALAAILDLEAPTEPIVRETQRFAGLAHRTAYVSTLRGVRFYDDSKGTNVGASVTAIDGLLEPKIVLIAGGKDKGGSYGPLADALRTKGRAAVLLGEAAPLIARALDGVVPTRIVTTMDEAVAASMQFAQTGDAVLLSPACSSFDMFRDYKHRGDVFVEAVQRLERNL